MPRFANRGARARLPAASGRARRRSGWQAAAGAWSALLSLSVSEPSFSALAGDLMGHPDRDLAGIYLVAAFLGLAILQLVLLVRHGQPLGKKWTGARIVTFPEEGEPAPAGSWEGAFSSTASSAPS